MSMEPAGVDPGRDLDRYEPNGDNFKQCPYCGDEHNPTDTVRTVDGRQAPAVNFINSDFRGHSGIRLYHEKCWQKRELLRKAVENESLDNYT